LDEDILSQGDDDREPSPWPRRLAVIATVAAVTACVVAYLAQPHHRQATSVARPTPTAARPRPTPTLTPAVTINLPVEPDAIVGPTAPWADGPRLPLAAAQPAWFYPAAGRTERIGGLPADPAGFEFTRVVGGWAIQARAVPAGQVKADESQAEAAHGIPYVRSVCGQCTGAPRPVWFLADRAQSATPVGAANLVAPGVTAGAMWLTSYPSGANLDTAAGRAREVSGTGATLAPPVRLPAGSVIDTATDRGLLLTPENLKPGTAVGRLWNPASAAFGAAFNRVIAASATEIAWTSRCAPTVCRVEVLNLATGRSTAIGLPAGDSAAGAAFSPAGDLLALQLGYGGDGEQATRLAVASVADGRVTPVPGTSVGSDTLGGFGWPADADRLVAEFNFVGAVQLASWRPGAGRLAVSDVTSGRAQASLVVG
jgi:hypothetical protein